MGAFGVKALYIARHEKRVNADLGKLDAEKPVLQLPQGDGPNDIGMDEDNKVRFENGDLGQKSLIGAADTHFSASENIVQTRNVPIKKTNHRMVVAGEPISQLVGVIIVARREILHLIAANDHHTHGKGSSKFPGIQIRLGTFIAAIFTRWVKKIRSAWKAIPVALRVWDVCSPFLILRLLTITVDHSMGADQQVYLRIAN